MAAEGPSTKLVLRLLATVGAVCALLYVLYLVRSVLGLIAIAIFLAIVLGPPVDLISRRLIPRALAILLVYVVIVAGIVGIGTLFVPPLVSGVNSLSQDAPTYIAKLRRNPTFRQYDNRYHITTSVQRQASGLPQRLSQAAGALSNVTVGVFNAIFQLITVLTISFFLLLDGQRLLRRALEVVNPSHAAGLEATARAIYRAVAGYVAGNLAISLVAGAVSLVTMLILGIPFAVPLSVLMAFFDLVPLVGSTIGAVVVGVVTLFTGFPTTTIVWAVVQLIYQQLESSVIVPIVYRRTVNVNGLLTIIALLIGAQLLGILGALVAIPVAGAIQIVAQQVWRARRPAPGPGAEEASVSL